MWETNPQERLNRKAIWIWQLRLPNWNQHFLHSGRCVCQMRSRVILFQHFPFFIEAAHIAQISGGKASEPGQFLIQLLTDGINCTLPPESVPRMEWNILPDTIIEHELLFIDRTSCLVWLWRMAFLIAFTASSYCRFSSILHLRSFVRMPIFYHAAVRNERRTNEKLSYGNRPSVLLFLYNFRLIWRSGFAGTSSHTFSLRSTEKTGNPPLFTEIKSTVPPGGCHKTVLWRDPALFTMQDPFSFSLIQIHVHVF